MNSSSELHPCKKIKLVSVTQQDSVSNGINEIVPSNCHAFKNNLHTQSQISNQCNENKIKISDIDVHKTDLISNEDTEDDVFMFPPDENIYDMLDGNNLTGTFPTVTNRYLTPFYKVNVQKPGDDICIMIHTNRICMLCLAPSHTIFKTGAQISKVDFKVSDKLDRALNKVSGKGKHGAQPLQANSNICIVTCTGGQTYTIKCCIIGKLVEVNEMLLNDPELLKKPPHKGGYLAIVLPNIQLLDKMKESLLTQVQYQSLIMEELNTENKHDESIIKDSIADIHIAKNLNNDIMHRPESNSTCKKQEQSTPSSTHTIKS